MTKTEKMWIEEIAHEYPKQWILVVNMEFNKNTKKYVGDVYYVTPGKHEAYERSRAIGDSMGNKMVVEGFNDKPQISGVYMWNQ